MFFTVRQALLSQRKLSLPAVRLDLLHVKQVFGYFFFFLLQIGAIPLLCPIHLSTCWQDDRCLYFESISMNCEAIVLKAML